MTQTRPSAGDMTGVQKAKMTKEAAQEVEERSAEMSMATAAKTHEEAVGVFDAQSGERLDTPAPSYVAVDVEEEKAAPGFGNQYGDDELVLTGKEDPDEVSAQLASQRAQVVPPSRVQTARSSMVKVRVDQDVEDMTYGMRNGEPNNYNFKEGMTYQVPVEVADHLDQRGLVRQWVR